MNDYPPLTSMALKVLFRHFTQYQELIEDMKQVQLLVSNNDVDHYHQIDRDLFILKNLTEKSELWVHWDTSSSSTLKSMPTPHPTSEDRSRSLSGEDLNIEDHVDENERATSSTPNDTRIIPEHEMPPHTYIDFLTEHYPSVKQKCIGYLHEMLYDPDKDLMATSLHSIMDKAPLIAYLIVKDILHRMLKL
uniref:Uncharacterized protein n=1 Tax=Panagrolaimus sp. PS1159 TaxID=55785 RepID=A0AC35F8E9_9BILA